MELAPPVTPELHFLSMWGGSQIIQEYKLEQSKSSNKNGAYKDSKREKKKKRLRIMQIQCSAWQRLRYSVPFSPSLTHRLGWRPLKPLGHMQLHGTRKTASESDEGAGWSYCRAIPYHLWKVWNGDPDVPNPQDQEKSYHQVGMENLENHLLSQSHFSPCKDYVRNLVLKHTKPKSNQ